MSDQETYPRCETCGYIIPDTKEAQYDDAECARHGLVQLDWGCIDHSDLEDDE